MAAGGPIAEMNQQHPVVQLRQRAKSPVFGECPFLVYRPMGSTADQEVVLSYADVYTEARRLAAFLQSQLPSEAGVVAVWMGEGVQHIVAMFAIWMLAKTYMPLPVEPVAEQQHQSEDRAVKIRQAFEQLAGNFKRFATLPKEYFMGQQLTAPMWLIKANDTRVFKGFAISEREQTTGWCELTPTYSIHACPGNHFSLFDAPEFPALFQAALTQLVRAPSVPNILNMLRRDFCERYAVSEPQPLQITFGRGLMQDPLHFLNRLSRGELKHVQIVGPRGAGKSHVAAEWLRAFPATDVVIPLQNMRLHHSITDPTAILVLDGLQVGQEPMDIAEWPLAKRVCVYTDGMDYKIGEPAITPKTLNGFMLPLAVEMVDAVMLSMGIELSKPQKQLLVNPQLFDWFLTLARDASQHSALAKLNDRFSLLMHMADYIRTQKIQSLAECQIPRGMTRESLQERFALFSMAYAYHLVTGDGACMRVWADTHSDVQLFKALFVEHSQLTEFWSARYLVGQLQSTEPETALATLSETSVNHNPLLTSVRETVALLLAHQEQAPLIKQWRRL